jgi:hypothetical protein
MGKWLIYLFMVVVLCSIGYARNVSIEAQLFDTSNNILSGSHTVNITIYNSTNHTVYSNTSVVSLDANGRFFRYVNTTYHFDDSTYVTFTVDADSETSQALIGYVPNAINARYINGSSILDYVPYVGATANVDLGNKNVTTTGDVSARIMSIYNPVPPEDYLYFDNQSNYLMFEKGGQAFELSADLYMLDGEAIWFGGGAGSASSEGSIYSDGTDVFFTGSAGTDLVMGSFDKYTFDEEITMVDGKTITWGAGSAIIEAGATADDMTFKVGGGGTNRALTLMGLNSTAYFHDWNITTTGIVNTPQINDASTDTLGINTAPVANQMLTSSFTNPSDSASSYMRKDTYTLSGGAAEDEELYQYGHYMDINVAGTIEPASEYVSSQNVYGQYVDISSSLNASSVDDTFSLFGYYSLVNHVSGTAQDAYLYGGWFQSSGNLETGGPVSNHYGIVATALSVADNNYGGFFSASGATNNYGIYVAAGNVNLGSGAVTSTGTITTTKNITATVHTGKNKSYGIWSNDTDMIIGFIEGLP